MNTLSKTIGRWCGAILTSLLLVMASNANAQTTTPGVKVDILGVGAEFLLGGDLTDPDNNGLDELGAATDPSWNWAEITSSHEPDFEGGENSFNIFDNKVGGGNDKWCCDDPTADVPVWVAVKFKTQVRLTHFTVTSGNDTPDRDPTDWAIQGSNNGTSWTDIYRFVDTTVPWNERNQVAKFTLPSAAPAYTYIRYIANETPGSLHQINEIEYFGQLGAGEAPIKNGLVAYWNFDANNFEDSIGIFDGTANGAAAIPFVNGRAGFGKAIKMDGEDQYIEITGGEPDALAFEAGSMSIAGWFKVDAFDTDWQALVAKGEGNSWRVHRRGGETGFAHAGGVGEGPAGAAVDDGAWHHFVAISDKDAVNFGTALYIDGVKYTEFAGAPNLAANGKRMMIGENPDALNRQWEGELDDIAIWNRVLAESEIAQLFAKPLSALLGAVAGDADGDGMPDDFETANGFNPNDASDAAKDFDGDGVSNLDEFKAGSNPSDVAKPTIAAIAGTGDFKTVNITFSEDVDPATAAVAANYTITPSLAVTAATYNRKVVTLTTAAQAPGGTAYTVEVKGVKDLSKNEVAAGTKAVFYSYLLVKDGALRIAVWEGIPGASPVENLTDDPRYPATPDRTGAIYSFNSRDFLPSDSLENYGASIEGYVTPAESGSYRFFIYSDDASRLFLSTDDKEANLVQIAEETGCCAFFGEPDREETSEPIALVAGRKYFIRLIYKEGGGGDYGQVAWRKEGDTAPAGSLRPIPSQFLSSAVDLPAPAEGGFTTQTPAPNARNVSPALTITVGHRDGKVAWTAENTSLKLDGAAVQATFTKVGNTLTLTHTPSGLLASKSSHTISLTHPDPAGQPTTTAWSFEAAEYQGPVKDVVKGYNALLRTAGKQTDDKGGVSGAAGDYGIDETRAGGTLQVADSAFFAALNTATAADELSISMWIKKYDISASSAFWLSGPDQDRAFQAHTPWSDNNVYFDTGGGCCDGTTQRISAGIDTFPGYVGDTTDTTWWQSWRNYVFTKKADAKQIYIDGVLFLEGSSSAKLSALINSVIIGGGPTANDNKMHAVIDDVAFYGKALTAANATALKGGTKPNALPATTGLVAYWDFNTPITAPADAKISIARDGANLSITFTGKLQSADAVNGPYSDVAGATSPRQVTPTGAAKFYRSAQ